MAGWISSKLKVAETFLQQIDQQAAESLGKNERPRLDDDASVGRTLTRTESIPLKDQLKKKSGDRNDAHGNLRRESNLERQWKKSDSTEKPNSITPKSDVSSAAAAAADRDWTELLGSPDPIATVGSRPKRDQKKHGILVSSQRKVARSAVKDTTRLDVSVDRNRDLDASGGNGKRSDEELPLSGSTDLSDSVGGKPALASPVSDGNAMVEHTVDANGNSGKLETSENGIQSHSGDARGEEDGMVPVTLSGVFDGIDLKTEVRGNSIVKRDGPGVSVGHPIPNDLPGSSSGSDERSDSDSDSGSSSDSENEIRRREERRKRQEQILAEEAAAKANEAIKEWENMVARLEGERQSLEKILEERERQQAQEASELQTSMTEIMEAVELEKQKHNSTRMEALTRLAKLETTNAELARLLATTQRNLEVEVDQVAELKRQIDLKEVANEELKRRMSNIHKSVSSFDEKRASKGVEFKQEILEAEYSVVCDKVGQLQEKAKQLDKNIEMTRKEIEEPTEVEIELKKRLGQMTDHLIQKQAQVEALASEKATLLFRLETVSRLLDESKSSPVLVDLAGTSDIEAGAWSMTNMRHKPLLRDRFLSGRQHLGSILQQLDAIFSAGAVFLRRNPTAQLWALVYLVCLHLWVLYILTSHSQASDEARSGAVISLQSINKTSGV